jgi:hypothetical protein
MIIHGLSTFPVARLLIFKSLTRTGYETRDGFIIISQLLAPKLNVDPTDSQQPLFWLLLADRFK